MGLTEMPSVLTVGRLKKYLLNISHFFGTYSALYTIPILEGFSLDYGFKSIDLQIQEPL